MTVVMAESASWHHVHTTHLCQLARHVCTAPPPSPHERTDTTSNTRLPAGHVVSAVLNASSWVWSPVQKRQWWKSNTIGMPAAGNRHTHRQVRQEQHGSTESYAMACLRQLYVGYYSLCIMYMYCHASIHMCDSHPPARHNPMPVHPPRHHPPVASCTFIKSTTLYRLALSSFSTVRRALQLGLSRSLTTCLFCV